MVGGWLATKVDDKINHMSTDFIAAFRAALDIVEVRALAAGGDAWVPQDHPSDSVAVYDSKREPVVFDESWPTPEQMIHIADHHPAFALADVAAKRAVIDAFEAAVRSAPGAYPPDASGLGQAVRLLAEAYGIRTVSPPDEESVPETDEQLHARCAHPAYEYATTEGQRKQWDDVDVPPCGDDGVPDSSWERNTDAGRDGWDRFDYTEESYWRRLRSGGTQ